jgi:hypothetical protein
MGSQDGVPWADEIDRFDAPPNLIEKMSEATVVGDPAEPLDKAGAIQKHQ